MDNRLNKVITVISLGLFMYALTQKCYCTTASCADSFAVLLSGTLGWVFGGATLTWFANPLLILSWFTINKKPKLSLICSLLAVLISLSFLLFKRIISDEAGNYKEIISYRLGYWLWVASSSIMFIGNALSFLFTQHSEKMK
ncbi:hypothetical protein NF867_07715 [Solitalea sp. MAHUQ-68]|uniref:Uncharacterized protein n=1 Tax=Solitalea agri TaxID=2953739 RepID=A0A9X2F267_9SPHI|nr:hypothetical protein [Solitalea agri]MCO4292745.1 hypothetical protein [Solitalea agri]